MKGEYRVKHPDMKDLYDEAQFLIHQFNEATITHNLRHKNELADRLANLAMDRKRDVTDATVDESPVDAPSARRDEGRRPVRLPEMWLCDYGEQAVVGPAASAQAVRLPVRDEDATARKGRRLRCLNEFESA
jgi:hypothetical protein